MGVPRLRRYPFGDPNAVKAKPQLRVISFQQPAKRGTTFTIDLVTHKYMGYREHTPGSMIIAPADCIEQRYEDVLDAAIVEKMEQSMRAAKRQSDTRFDYELRGRARTGFTALRGQTLLLNVMNRLTVLSITVTSLLGA